MKLDYSRHSAIVTLILALVVCTVIIVFAIRGYGDGKDCLRISRDVWFCENMQTDSYSAFGYAALYESLRKLYGATIHYFPWTPDANPEKRQDAAGFFLVVNAPERCWNHDEASQLAKFVRAGGGLLVIVPSFEVLDNIQELFKAFELNYVSRKNVNDVSLYSVSCQTAAGIDGMFNGTYAIRLSETRTHGLFRAAVFETLLCDEQGNPVFSRLSAGGGYVYFLHSLMPGFNAELSDPDFPQDSFSDMIESSGIEKIAPKFAEIAHKVKNEIETPADEELKISRSKPGELRSGLSLLQTIFDNASNNGKQIVFFDYLRDKQTKSGLLSVFSSGAFYALVLAVAFMVAGLLFFVRDTIPLPVIIQKRIMDLRATPQREGDPPVMRQAKSRFVAQYIQLSHMLKKTRG